MANIITIKSPRWADPERAENRRIDCIIKFEGDDEEYPFTASQSDPEPHGRDIYKRICAGCHGDIAAYELPEESGANENQNE